MNWFGGQLRVRLQNGNTYVINDVPFNEAAIKRALDENIRPQFTTEVMYIPHAICVDIPMEHRATP